jgi:hypothetical protein
MECHYGGFKKQDVFKEDRWRIIIYEYQNCWPLYFFITGFQVHICCGLPPEVLTTIDIIFGKWRNFVVIFPIFDVISSCT